MDVQQPVKDLVYKASADARLIIEDALRRAVEKGVLPDAPPPEFVIEPPGDSSHGDLASNVAMTGARVYRKKPLEIANAILGELDLAHDSCFDRAEVKAPGFINLFFRRDWFAHVISTILELGDTYGHTNYGKGEKIMVEFVSANPTGLMTLGNARGGALGDTLASALDAAGYDVTREFYVNDAGNQILKFAASVEARYLERFLGGGAPPFPEDGYHGEEIKGYAAECAERFGDSLVSVPGEKRREAIISFSIPRNIEKMERDLLNYRVSYEKWFHEDSELHQTGAVGRVINLLREKGLTYEKDGAVWFKDTEFGAEKDVVYIRQNGTYTYYAVDAAYHYNKFAIRGYTTVINVWGADHHGSVGRLKNAVSALGIDNSRLEILMMQFVHMIKDGKPYAMSKRAGHAVTLSDLIEEIPVDAARFFFIQQGPGSPINFDLDLAAKQSSENPVYYVQYAHARICSILKKLDEEGISIRNCTDEDLALLTAPEETQLIRLLAAYPGEIIKAAVQRDPSRLAHFLKDLAGQFHKFYTSCHVRCGQEDLMQARIALCVAAKTVFYNLLTLLKISAPEAM